MENLIFYCNFIFFLLQTEVPKMWGKLWQKVAIKQQNVGLTNAADWYGMCGKSLLNGKNVVFIICLLFLTEN